MAKTEAEKKEQRRQKKEAEEKAAKESPGTKKAKIRSSSPVPEGPATSPSEQATVASKPSSASKRATKSKVVSFVYGVPVNGTPYRPEDEFSDDDDGPAIATKKQEMRDIAERYSQYHVQLLYPHKNPSQVGGLTEGIDCPFWSLDNKANHSRLFFGPLVDMHESVWHETARRVLIVREFLLSFENRMVDQHFLEESDTRSEEIPRGEWTAQDISQAGWTLGEYRTVMRRLTRKLVEWARVDNFDRAQDSKNRDKDMPIPMQLDDFYMDFDAEREEGDIYSDDEDFVEDVEKYIGSRKPIFDNCFAFIQKGMPNTLIDVFSVLIRIEIHIKIIQLHWDWHVFVAIFALLSSFKIVNKSPRHQFSG